MSIRASAIAFVLSAAAIAAPVASHAASPDCPNGGTIRFGIEPYDTAPTLTPIYQEIGKLEIGEFGPLGYILAHEVAKAEAVATLADKDGHPSTYWASIVTYPATGFKTLQDIKGHSFAYSDPASTSGHLFPAYALRKAGLDPNTDVKAVYAGSHTASFEALHNHKVDAGELNSQQIASATLAGVYSPEQFVTLWQSAPIPQDPITLRSTLPPAAKQKIKAALLNFDFTTLP